MIAGDAGTDECWYFEGFYNGVATIHVDKAVV